MTPQTVLITNIPAPYRESIHEKAAAQLNGSYTVIYCNQNESNRDWKVHEGNYPQITLKSRVLEYRGRYIHTNPDIWSQLKRLKPEVVITTGFNPTMLIAFAWCTLHRKKHIAMTDGWLGSEAELSAVHRLVRRQVFKRSHAFIGASRHSLDLYRAYQCNESALFQSHLCADNARFESVRNSTEKQYDIMFSGQFIERKMPLFFADVAGKIAKLRGKCSVLVLGSGPLQSTFMDALDHPDIKLEYPGYVSQDRLPELYASARLFLFPTLQDPWGVVANEACAAGTPVITCNNAGAANDLVQHEKNGLILPLDADLWAAKAVELLQDNAMYKAFTDAAAAAVEPFNYDHAAQGIVDAVHHATGTCA